MLRGEICLTDLDPVQGREAGTRRPAVLVGNDRANVRRQRSRPALRPAQRSHPDPDVPERATDRSSTTRQDVAEKAIGPVARVKKGVY
jgi:PemK-like, MazF-like toxin of type II toxin-antitoxin system